MRLEARLKNARSSSPTPNSGSSVSTPGSNDTKSYAEKLKSMRAKYWDDLLVVYREFTRMASQKPSGESAQQVQQQERIKNFLQNLKRIMTLLQQDPMRLTSNNGAVFERVE